MKRILRTAFLATALPALALAQSADGFDTEVRLDSGNIELAVIDGTNISVAPGSHLTIDHANGPGEVTRINVLKGEFRISNVFHKHSDVVLIRAGDHTFELNRGAALITHTGTGPQGTLLHGASLSIQGRDRTLTRPGRRLKLRSGSKLIEEDQTDVDAINKSMNNVSGRKSAKAGAGAGNSLRAGLGQRVRNRKKGVQLPGANRARSQIQQRGNLNTVLQAQQGLGIPPPKPPKVKPPKPPKVKLPKPPKPPVI